MSFLNPARSSEPWRRACRERYDVDLVLTKFEGSMYDTMKLMATTDLFMGMHGAGFTNVLYLPQVRFRPSGGQE